MPTNRVPLRRPRREPRFPRFSDAALNAFREMQKLERKGHDWRNEHDILLRELGIKPWQFPAVQRPGTGTNMEAQARYRLLEEALKQESVS